MILSRKKLHLTINYLLLLFILFLPFFQSLINIRLIIKVNIVLGIIMILNSILLFNYMIKNKERINYFGMAIVFVIGVAFLLIFYSLKK